MPSVGTTAVRIGNAPCLIQNLGPTANLFVGGSDVTTANGVKVANGKSIAVGHTNDAIYVVADAASADVRVLPRGAGFFS